MGLVRRPKKRARLPEGMRKPSDTAGALNEVWSMDFMSDSFKDRSWECLVCDAFSKGGKILNARIELRLSYLPIYFSQI